MSEETLDYFVSRGLLPRRDAAEMSWSHAVNSRKSLAEALTGPTHMIEADVLIRGREPREPIMAHPPDTDSDITLREWLESVKDHDNKGIKLDFKSLEALSPSLLLLHELLVPGRPVWINADILPGPGGWSQPLDARSFISVVSVLRLDTVLSLGWTTGWKAGGENPGYSWEMVHQMEELCRNLQHDITFAVRAALLSSSAPQLTWLLQQSDRFSLTVWTGKSDEFPLEDLLPFRKQFNVSRIYYDLPQSWRTQLCSAPED
ncbi:protein FAM151B isoform X2 [Gouania willdenowi]|nr:protein FAM151B isoform X2 [Gouania willdenowi]